MNFESNQGLEVMREINNITPTNMNMYEIQIIILLRIDHITLKNQKIQIMISRSHKRHKNK